MPARASTASTSVATSRSMPASAGNRPSRHTASRRWTALSIEISTVSATPNVQRMRLARVIGGIGRMLIGLGVLLLLFVGYQLWGTSLQEARAQDRLGDSFDAALSSTTTAPASKPDEPDTTSTIAEPQPPPIAGDAAGQIRIPKIGLTR